MTILVVIDTNIVVSAKLRSGGLPNAVFSLAIHGKFQLYFSEPVFAEYEEVLRRPRLAIHPDKVTQAPARIREAGLLVNRTIPLSAGGDPDDNMFLECAQAADAHYIITVNPANFPLLWQGTRIVTVRQFFEVIADARSGGTASS